MVRGLFVLIAVIFLALALFIFFKAKSVEYYSCVSKDDGKEFSLKLQKREEVVHVKIDDDKEPIDTSCEHIQGKENTYKCYVKDAKEDIGEVKIYLVLKEKKGALELYPAIELVISKTEKPFTLVSLNSGQTLKEYRVSTVQFWEALGGYVLEKALENLFKFFFSMLMPDEEKWAKICEKAGGKIVEGTLCVIDKPYATCEEKNPLVSYIQEVFK